MGAKDLPFSGILHYPFSIIHFPFTNGTDVVIRFPLFKTNPEGICTAIPHSSFLIPHS